MPSVKATLASRQALLDDHTVQVSKTVQGNDCFGNPNFAYA